MSSNLNLGEVNGPVVGIILKELVRRAIGEIRELRHTFEASLKPGHEGNMDDVFTNADRAAQSIYTKVLCECFPSAGIIAEENRLCLNPAGTQAYFTIDPLDGTRAFIRRQSHGVGTMVALVVEGEVVSAWVGDVNTQEVFGYRPGSDKVHWISEFDTAQQLPNGRKVNLGSSYLLLRDRELHHSILAQRTTGCFKNLEINSGSIGIWMSRLWKQEVGGLIVRAGHETTWDATPIYGISRKLGYRFYAPVGNQKWQQFQPKITSETIYRPHEMLIIHGDNEQEMRDNGMVV